MEEVITIESDEDSCSICLNDSIEIANVCITSCNHSFCEPCLTNWFDQGKNTCPLCRVKIDYFNSNNVETRIISISTQRNSNTRLNIPVTQLVTELSTRNIRLKSIAYFLVLGGALLLDLYMSLRFDYEDLRIDYHSCLQNVTDLHNEIEVLEVEYHDYITVGIIYDNLHHYKLCEIPRYFYYKCFESIKDIKDI